MEQLEGVSGDWVSAKGVAAKACQMPFAMWFSAKSSARKRVAPRLIHRVLKRDRDTRALNHSMGMILERGSYQITPAFCLLDLTSI